MDAASAALLGMGLAAAGFAGAGVGIGYIFGKMIEAVARQPEAEGRVGKYMWIGFALVEAIALYGIVIAFIIMGLRKSKDEVLMPQFDTQFFSALLFWEWVSFGVLLLILYKYDFAWLLASLDARERKIRE